MALSRTLLRLSAVSTDAPASSKTTLKRSSGDVVTTVSSRGELRGQERWPAGRKYLAHVCDVLFDTRYR